MNCFGMGRDSMRHAGGATTLAAKVFVTPPRAAGSRQVLETETVIPILMQFPQFVMMANY